MKLLSGFTVLDLGTFITAPYAAMLLAELGADVIKVERPDGGDPFRWFAGGLSSPHFQAHNRHKRSVALDCTTTRGLELLHSLVQRADALVINVRPGVEKHDVPFAPERRLSELNEDPQARHLDLFYDLAHPAAGNVRSVHRAHPLRRKPGDRFSSAAGAGRAHARGALRPRSVG